METTFIYLAIIFAFLLIWADTALFLFRKNSSAKGNPFPLNPLSVIQQNLAKLKWFPRAKDSSLPSPMSISSNQTTSNGVEHSKGRIDDTPSGLPETDPVHKEKESTKHNESEFGSLSNRETNMDQITREQPAAAAVFFENHSDTSETQRENEKDQFQEEVNLGQPKMIHINFSADIPEGTIVNLTLEVVDAKGQTSISRTTLTNKTIQDSRVFLPASDGSTPIMRSQSPVRKSSITGRFPSWVLLYKQIVTGAGLFFSKVRHAVTTRFLSWNLGNKHLDQILLLAALAVYAIVVSFGIDRYPIYFFTDEAIHMNLASDFIRDGFKNYFGEFLPTFFTTEGWVNGTSVYVQILPFILFGKSVIVTRLVSAIISFVGAFTLGLLLRDVFKLKYYWAGILMLLTTPAWFLHARTAFEYVEVGSFYSIFLYFYSRYRSGHLRSLYWSVIAGALTFYTHGLGQILMGVSGVALLIVDFRYHIHPDRRKTILYGFLLAVILLLPFARYYLAHPLEAAEQVKRRGSYWANNDLSVTNKLGDFFSQYFYGLNPAYWYFTNNVDLNRHIMTGYGNGLWYTIPFMAIGLFQVLKNIRLPSYRILLISLMTCPIPASVVAIGMPRMLWMAIPIALISVIGLSSVLQWFENRWHSKANWITAVLFIVMTSLSFYMLRDALVKGPTWVEDYSLYGMQYGAEQVFKDVVKTGLEQDSSRRYIVSPSWANGTEQFVDFFIPKSLQNRVSMGQPIDYIKDIRTGTQGLYFIATSDEYDKLIANPEFKDIIVHDVIPFPNKKPGFYVLTLDVANNIEGILAAEHEKNRAPVENTLSVNGQNFRVIHSPLGSGRLEDVFDDNPDTLARVLEANPFTFDIFPASPITTNGIFIKTGSLVKFTVTVSLYPPGASDPVIYTQTFANLPPDPQVTLTFDKGPENSARISITIKDELSGDTSQIHVRTIQFK